MFLAKTGVRIFNAQFAQTNSPTSEWPSDNLQDCPDYTDPSTMLTKSQ